MVRQAGLSKFPGIYSTWDVFGRAEVINFHDVITANVNDLNGKDMNIMNHGSI